MDRFEDDTAETVAELCRIYIPVWIDLKNVLNSLCKLKIRIYIPVWIDLKRYVSVLTDAFTKFTFQYG